MRRWPTCWCRRVRVAGLLVVHQSPPTAKGFQRLTLQPGETQKVAFPVGREQLQYLDESMCLTVELGQFELMVGGSSDRAISVTSTVEKA